MKSFIIALLVLTLVGCTKDPIYNNTGMLAREVQDTTLIGGLRGNTNPQSALFNAWGGNLEDRIRSDFQNRGKPLSLEAKIQLQQKKDSSIIKLESKDGTLEGLVQAGEVLVIVTNDKNNHNGKYFLACLNGMVSEYNPADYHDRGLIRNYPFRFTVKKGNGFTQVLSNQEAIQAAADLGKPVHSNKLNEAVVIVPVEFCLQKRNPSARWEECK